MNAILPLEIERNVFEICAQTERSHAPTLLRVSRYVLIWIQPIIYEVLAVHTQKMRSPSVQAVQAHGQHVRHLLIGPNTSEELINACLLACPNVVNFALSYVGRLSDHSRELVRLSIHFPNIIDAVPDEEAPPPPDEVINFLASFPQLTYLNVASCIPFDIIPCLKVLPSLSYLSLPNDKGDILRMKPLPVIFESNPRLKVIYTSWRSRALRILKTVRRR
ncbi:hypothetical protein BDN72DRAFT_435376 [Pluteus cervinus]|uniref:Uncharacterized protein n=1 Tax=Pluteus cervinus TaxID=181527 RepID=A0ACD3A6W2_9AGAR|nr:hypothetical protein BDN72DRAFT_435376 [Pluteus cervinus]